MRGFSEKWNDLPDYILGITKEIWEGRGIDTLNHYYEENIPMRLPEGVSIGNKKTINGTLATLAEFPELVELEVNLNDLLPATNDFLSLDEL